MSADNARSRFASSAGAVDEDPEASLSPLESEVLEEYALLRDNLDRLSAHLARLAGSETTSIAAAAAAAAAGGGGAGRGEAAGTAAAPAISDALRALERKTSLVCTALKASVYGILLQQQLLPGAEGD